jgi:hypothetical protein
MLKPALLALAMLSSLACGPAKSASGDCSSYGCDEAGAKDMMWATLEGAYKPSDKARTAFEGVVENGVKVMAKENAFVPESFELARGNLQKFLSEIPENGEDPLTPALEDLKNKTAKACSLWPYC